ncbi:MAG: glycoside hydrolase family 97 C-terminal domain-containing protein [Kiritimatiellae bacterium]|nr:glycoside hydrolase family 97 C-terminal domain-containing protein [Kiritimatiellia bacterium]
MRPSTSMLELVSPAKRVRAEVGVETVWIGSTVYPDCPVWRVWFDARLVLDTSTMGLAPRTGTPLTCGMHMAKVSRHRVPTGLGKGHEARVRFAGRDGREFEMRLRVTDMSAFCHVRMPRSRVQSGTDLSVTRFPEGSVLWGAEGEFNVQRLTFNAQCPTLTDETGEPQVRFAPGGKVVAFWRRGSEQHLVFFDRPGELAERRFDVLEQLGGLVVKDGRAGIGMLFQKLPFTKESLIAAVFGEALTPSYRAAFDLVSSAGGDDFCVMRGEPGQFMVAARRQGAVWTVGGVTSEPRTLTVRFEDLWLRAPAEVRALRYTVNILRDPLPEEAVGLVREVFAGQSPDVRVVLDLARDGGFMLEFVAESG